MVNFTAQMNAISGPSTNQAQTANNPTTWTSSNAGYEPSRGGEGVRHEKTSTNPSQTVSANNPTTRTPSNAGYEPRKRGGHEDNPDGPRGTQTPVSHEPRQSGGHEAPDTQTPVSQTEAIHAVLLQRRIRKQNTERSRRSGPNGGARSNPSRRLPTGNDKQSGHDDSDEDMDMDGPDASELGRKREVQREERYEEDGDSEGDSERRPVTRRSVEHIARNVVKDELRKSSDFQNPTKRPNRKYTSLEEEKKGINKEERKWYCVSDRPRPPMLILTKYTPN